MAGQYIRPGAVLIFELELISVLVTSRNPSLTSLLSAIPLCLFFAAAPPPPHPPALTSWRAWARRNLKLDIGGGAREARRPLRRSPFASLCRPDAVCAERRRQALPAQGRRRARLPEPEPGRGARPGKESGPRRPRKSGAPRIPRGAAAGSGRAVGPRPVRGRQGVRVGGPAKASGVGWGG